MNCAFSVGLSALLTSGARVYEYISASIQVDCHVYVSRIMCRGMYDNWDVYRRVLERA